MSATTLTQEQFNALATSTLRRYDPNLIDQIFTATPVLNLMRERGRVKEISGGRQIAPALLYEGNSTVMAYEGADVLDTTYLRAA